MDARALDEPVVRRPATPVEHLVHAALEKYTIVKFLSIGGKTKMDLVITKKVVKAARGKDLRYTTAQLDEAVSVIKDTRSMLMECCRKMIEHVPDISPSVPEIFSALKDGSVKPAREMIEAFPEFVRHLCLPALRRNTGLARVSKTAVSMPLMHMPGSPSKVPNETPSADDSGYKVAKVLELAVEGEDSNLTLLRDVAKDDQPFSLTEIQERNELRWLVIFMRNRHMRLAKWAYNRVNKLYKQFFFHVDAVVDAYNNVSFIDKSETSNSGTVNLRLRGVGTLEVDTHTYAKWAWLKSLRQHVASMRILQDNIAALVCIEHVGVNVVSVAERILLKTMPAGAYDNNFERLDSDVAFAGEFRGHGPLWGQATPVPPATYPSDPEAPNTELLHFALLYRGCCPAKSELTPSKTGSVLDEVYYTRIEKAMNEDDGEDAGGSVVTPRDAVNVHQSMADRRSYISPYSPVVNHKTAPNDRRHTEAEPELDDESQLFCDRFGAGVKAARAKSTELWAQLVEMQDMADLLDRHVTSSSHKVVESASRWFSISKLWTLCGVRCVRPCFQLTGKALLCCPRCTHALLSNVPSKCRCSAKKAVVMTSTAVVLSLFIYACRTIDTGPFTNHDPDDKMVVAVLKQVFRTLDATSSQVVEAGSDFVNFASAHASAATSRLLTPNDPRSRLGALTGFAHDYVPNWFGVSDMLSGIKKVQVESLSDFLSESFSYVVVQSKDYAVELLAATGTIGGGRYALNRLLGRMMATGTQQVLAGEFTPTWGSFRNLFTESLLDARLRASVYSMGLPPKERMDELMKRMRLGMARHEIGKESSYPYLFDALKKFEDNADTIQRAAQQGKVAAGIVGDVVHMASLVVPGANAALSLGSAALSLGNKFLNWYSTPSATDAASASAPAPVPASDDLHVFDACRPCPTGEPDSDGACAPAVTFVDNMRGKAAVLSGLMPGLTPTPKDAKEASVDTMASQVLKGAIAAPLADIPESHLPETPDPSGNSLTVADGTDEGAEQFFMDALDRFAPPPGDTDSSNDKFSLSVADSWRREDADDVLMRQKVRKEVADTTPATFEELLPGGRFAYDDIAQEGHYSAHLPYAVDEAFSAALSKVVDGNMKVLLDANRRRDMKRKKEKAAERLNRGLQRKGNSPSIDDVEELFQGSQQDS